MPFDLPVIHWLLPIFPRLTEVLDASVVVVAMLEPIRIDKTKTLLITLFNVYSARHPRTTYLSLKIKSACHPRASVSFVENLVRVPSLSQHHFHSRFSYAGRLLGI